jgi:hypothetical protein
VRRNQRASRARRRGNPIRSQCARPLPSAAQAEPVTLTARVLADGLDVTDESLIRGGTVCSVSALNVPWQNFVGIGYKAEVGSELAAQADMATSGAILA